jgi:hypothetical protein
MASRIICYDIGDDQILSAGSVDHETIWRLRMALQHRPEHDHSTLARLASLRHVESQHGNSLQAVRPEPTPTSAKAGAACR